MQNEARYQRFLEQGISIMDMDVIVCAADNFGIGDGTFPEIARVRTDLLNVLKPKEYAA